MKTKKSLRRNDWVWPFLDFLLILVLVLVTIVNPPKTEEKIKSPGQLHVEIRWPDTCASDIDLWVKSPNDIGVGYSRRTGKILNLLRDDRGKEGDLGELNYENVFSRGIVEGEYVVNVHLYRHYQPCETPVPINVRVSTYINHVRKRIFEDIAELGGDGHEVTVGRFFLDENGVFDTVRGINFVPMKLGPIGEAM